jgi:guanylate kinase
MPPIPIVIAGPSGVGKGTLIHMVMERDDLTRPGRMRLSQSWTTREKRPDESVDAYHFASNQEFQAAIDAGFFLEWSHHERGFYGSPPPPESDNAEILLYDIELNGAEALKRRYSNAYVIMIIPPGSTPGRRENSLHSRLKRRGEKDIDKRIQEGIVRMERVNERLPDGQKLVDQVVINGRRTEAARILYDWIEFFIEQERVKTST